MSRAGFVAIGRSLNRRSTRRAIARLAVGLRRSVPYLLVLLSISIADAHGGWLETIRDDVRGLPLPAASGGSPARSEEPAHDDDSDRHRPDHHRHHHYDDDHDTDWGGLYLVGGYLFVAGVTSPWWGPHVALNDDFDVDGYFPRFPYDGVPGYMVIADWAAQSLHEQGLCEEACGRHTDFSSLDPSLWRFRRWSARLRAEYARDFDDVSRIGGRLLLSTASRWGLDIEMSYLEENLRGGRHDQLWIGDCNLVFRFAQSEHMQWRTGLGFNWLDDPAATNFGFNFTYGVDYFPRKPWVFSSTLDWGTLGRAEQFRFHTTAGVLLWGIESYVGYEYLDIDRTQLNSLIGGVRIWF